MSYYFFKNYDMDEILGDIPPGTDTFADSGAFSAFQTGETLSVKDYAGWLHKWQHRFRLYANLDVKGSWEQGLSNMAHLEKEGLHPLPVFHAGEPMELLDDMIAKYPYIALGGVAGTFQKTTGDVMMGWFTQCFKKAQGKAVFHGFGIAHPQLMLAFPWYSVDTSSWAGARYGLVNLFDDRKGRFRRIQTGNFRSSIKHAYLFERHKLNWLDLADREHFNSRAVQVASIRAYMLMQDYYRGKHGEVYMPADRAGEPLYQPEPGIKVYLAFVNRVCVDMAHESVR